MSRVEAQSCHQRCIITRARPIVVDKLYARNYNTIFSMNIIPLAINIAVYKPEGNDSAVASKGKSNSSSSPDKDFLSFPNYPCIDYESRSRVGLNPRLERSIFHLAGPLLKLESLELHLVYFIGNYPSFHQAITDRAIELLDIPVADTSCPRAILITM